MIVKFQKHWKNVILFCKKKKKSFNVLLLLGFFIRNIKYLLKDLNYFLFSISNHNFLSGVILKKLKPF